MCDRITDESSTLEDIDTEEFVESLKNKNSKRKTFSVHKMLMYSLHTYGGFRAVDGIPVTELDKLLNHFYHSKKHNGDKYEPHTKAKQNRTDLFLSDEIQMLYCRAKLGACKLSNCTLMF